MNPYLPRIGAKNYMRNGSAPLSALATGIWVQCDSSSAHRAGFEVVHPDDPIAQTKYIFNDVDELIRANGYTRADIIRHETTFTKAVSEEAFQEIVKLLAEFFADCPVKPVAGTLRIVDSLSRPGLTVEYEFWLAR